jgi:hypothetical protein
MPQTFFFSSQGPELQFEQRSLLPHCLAFLAETELSPERCFAFHELLSLPTFFLAKLDTLARSHIPPEEATLEIYLLVYFFV